MTDAFERSMLTELEHARKLADEEDERMAAAARGEPFWRRGAATEVVGLQDFIPREATPMRLTPDEIEHIQRTGSYANGQRTISMAHFKALVATAQAALTATDSLITERFAGAVVEIPGGTIELGVQRNLGEPLELKRSELKRMASEEALALNGDPVNETTGQRLTDAIERRFVETWPSLGWFVEVWNGEDRLSQTYRRLPWPGDACHPRRR